MTKPWSRALLDVIRLLKLLLAGAVASVAGFAGEGGGSGFHLFLVLLLPVGFVWCVLASPGLVMRRGWRHGLVYPASFWASFSRSF